MAEIKMALMKADEMQPCGTIYSGEDLRQMAKADARFRYQPEDQTLYAYIDLGD